ncbi:uncharacterized protein EV154DRAFT_491728 [Mucor mucedo]|uniref:uncharacterized protein n=1 Tax=Mucor mucedo TaxID=29922 RepID=UPI002220061E|nr:uncharacterized protein EV154DRAFT_491728 [Mucor mucedo]KAI7896651.1 hypothetical protein EV154DRAFT_491728 [Mucor mucedo]
MAKVKNQEELRKPKFQQTKLCFGPVVTKKVSADYAKKLEESIQDLNISKKDQLGHDDPCQHCSKSTKRVKCTALKRGTEEECGLSYCTKCISEKVDESVEWIKSNKNEQFVHGNGDVIQHGKSKWRWACLVCRGLCDCKKCLGSTKRLSFNIEPTINKRKTVLDIEPPELTPIPLLYSEEEIWIRLQIREFIFRFGDVYGFENRLFTSLQNVQGDWRIKKLGAYTVWQCLTILYNSSLYENEESIPQLAKNILNSWITDKRLDNLYCDKEEKHAALLQILNTEGMTGRRWQDMAELLALAQVKDIPIPTTSDLKKKDADRMDTDDDEEEEENDEVSTKIARYQKCTNRSLVSVADELKMINMLLELLLYDIQIRQSLIAAGQKAMSKELRDEESEFKKYQKEWTQENNKHLLNRTTLSMRVNQLKSTKGKDKEFDEAQMSLDALETLIRDENQNLSKKKLELIIHTHKAEKRKRCLGHDMLGNEYWAFSDTLDHLNHATDYRNSEPYWAYGIIIIGPGFKKDKEQWWFIKGKSDMKLLKDWITNESKKLANDDLKRIAAGINDRINYLVSLETVVYGEGFFQ